MRSCLGQKSRLHLEALSPANRILAVGMGFVKQV